MIRMFPLLFVSLAWSGSASAACWASTPAPKSVVFTGSQSGAPFPGEFKSYSAFLCLDDKDLAKNKLKVEVDTSSVSTELPEMDEGLQDADFFDSAHFRQARFESDSLTVTSPGHYSVTGKLTIRDVTHTVTVPFTWTPAPDGKHARLEGVFTLQRLDYHVGQGQWADTTWVGNRVDLTFAVDFVPAPK